MMARIASGKTVSPRMVHSVGGRVMPREAPCRWMSATKRWRWCASGLNKVIERAGRHGLSLAHQRAGL